MASKKPKIEKFLALAKTLAADSDVYKYKHGCCIVKKGRIIAQGTNSYKSHPVQKQYNIAKRDDILEDAPHYIHAEMSALTKLRGIDLSDAQLYVYRITATGKPAISRPCPACMKAIIDSGIKDISYTTNEGIAQEILDTEATRDLWKKRY